MRGSLRLRVRRVRVGGRGRGRARREGLEVRVDGGVAGGDLLLIDVEERQVLLQDEEMFGSIVAGERGNNLGLGCVAPVVAMPGEALGVALAGDDSAQDALARDARDVRDHEGQLDIHLDERLLHPLHVRPGALDERRPVAQIGAQRDHGIVGPEAWPVTSYLVTNLTVLVFWIYFFVLNRTTIIGRHRVGTARNTLLVSNHQSMIDSFLVGLAAYFPRSLIMPHLMPWNPAAAENFFRTPILAWLAYNWRCISVREGRRDVEALRRMSEVLPHGVMTLFPEGTRTRDGSVGAGRAGTGLVVLSTRPRVIPVAIEGMDRALPIGRKMPRLFQRVYVCYGEPVDCEDFFDMPRTKQTAALLVDRVMSVIRDQHAELRRMAVADGAIGAP